MKKIIKIMEEVPAALKQLGLLGGICLLLCGSILIFESQMKKGLYDQQMAERWSEKKDVSQVSAFFADGAVEDAGYFQGTAQRVEQALKEASISKEKENARLWIQAVSKGGTVALTTERGAVQINAVGVSGEFFQFHPQKLIAGSLFREDSMMQDGIVIDRETAWQLFGSSDVAGMQVMIGQVPHVITGVVERPKGRLQEAAGLKDQICYLSMDSLEKYGIAEGGFTYEIVMPNPVRNFALSTIQSIFGTENEQVVVLENTSRYRILQLWKVIQGFGTRSMSLKGIIYPYWENAARGYEDILALLLLLKMILLLLPGIFILAVIIYIWRRKTWTAAQGIQWIRETLYEASAKRAKKKIKQEEEK